MESCSNQQFHGRGPAPNPMVGLKCVSSSALLFCLYLPSDEQVGQVGGDVVFEDDEALLRREIMDLPKNIGARKVGALYPRHPRGWIEEACCSRLVDPASLWTFYMFLFFRKTVFGVAPSLETGLRCVMRGSSLR